MVAGQPDGGRSGDAVGTGPVFETVWRGFDPDQVRAYLQLVTGRLQDLESRLERTQRLLEESRRERDRSGAAANPESYEAMSAHVMDLLRRFDEEAEGLRREAETEATDIVAKARAEVDRMRMDMQIEEQESRARAEELRRELREESDRLRAELTPVRDTTLEQLRAMHVYLMNTIQKLDEVLSHEPSREQVIVLEEADEVVR